MLTYTLMQCMSVPFTYRGSSPYVNMGNDGYPDQLSVSPHRVAVAKMTTTMMTKMRACHLRRRRLQSRNYFQSRVGLQREVQLKWFS